MKEPMAKTYKIWSDDLGYPEDDAYEVTPLHDWFDMEDTVHQLIESKYHDWENPDGPFDMLACEFADGQKVGDVQKFFVSVDWEPSFYVSPKK
jgi:hypothetical protein